MQEPEEEMKCVVRCKDCKKRLLQEEDKKKSNSKDLQKLKGGKKKKRHNNNKNKQVSFKTKSGKVVSFTRKN